MEHFRGHLYNWYDTQTLKPLNPRYVSTVDSGNMAAHLVTLQAGLAQWKYQPVMSLPCILEGLSDTFSLLKDQLSDTRSDIVEQIDAQLSLMQRASPADFHAGMQALLALSVLAEQAYLPTTRVNWPALFHQQLVDFTQEWSLLFSWVSPDAPLPADIPSLLWLAELNLNRPGLPEKQAETAIWAARERMAALLELDSRLSDHASMDFRFLYYPATSLLSVGYNMDSGLLDASKYDLFPSEVRLTHYFAISTSQLPAKSWFVLGRLFTQLNNQPAVMSWSGSMFEYLMPHLVMPVYPDTLLEKMALSAVRQQIASGNSTDTPWGVSESGYAAFDVNHNYQYRAFGTPELGLKRGLNDNHVVAPYATLLALMVLPQEATANLIRLKKWVPAVTTVITKRWISPRIDWLPVSHLRSSNRIWLIIRRWDCLRSLTSCWMRPWSRALCPVHCFSLRVCCFRKKCLMILSSIPHVAVLSKTVTLNSSAAFPTSVNSVVQIRASHNFSCFPMQIII